MRAPSLRSSSLSRGLASSRTHERDRKRRRCVRTSSECLEAGVGGARSLILVSVSA
jgi:hypothetical protein